jgi:hypothetical protein
MMCEYSWREVWGGGAGVKMLAATPRAANDSGEGEPMAPMTMPQRARQQASRSGWDNSFGRRSPKTVVVAHY